MSSSLLQVVNSLFQTCWQLGTSSANTTCWWLVSRLAASCQIFTCVVRDILQIVLINALLYGARKANLYENILYRLQCLYIVKAAMWNLKSLWGKEGEIFTRTIPERACVYISNDVIVSISASSLPSGACCANICMNASHMHMWLAWLAIMIHGSLLWLLYASYDSLARCQIFAKDNFPVWNGEL
jgi:hypothetical protein